MDFLKEYFEYVKKEILDKTNEIVKIMKERHKIKYYEEFKVKCQKQLLCKNCGEKAEYIEGYITDYDGLYVYAVSCSKCCSADIDIDDKDIETLINQYVSNT